MAYSRKALAELKQDPIEPEQLTLAALDPETPMDPGLVMGVYDERLGRFVDPKKWALDRCLEDFYSRTPDDADRTIS